MSRFNAVARELFDVSDKVLCRLGDLELHRVIYQLKCKDRLTNEMVNDIRRSEKRYDIRRGNEILHESQHFDLVCRRYLIEGGILEEDVEED